MKIFTLGLRGKSVLLLGSLVLAALLVMGGAIYHQAIDLAIDELLVSTETGLEKDADEIQAFVRSSRADLMVLATTPPVQGILRARDSGGTDPLTGDKTEYWYARLEQIFGAFLTYHPEYFQLRYLDDKGDEIVRVDRVGEAIRITPRRELQNKSRYPYFFQTMRLKPNETYYSEVNLNRERGAIQVPHTPVFRIATPVHDAAGAARGVVVANLLAEAMFSPARAAPMGTSKYIANESGSFLVHPDRAREYGFDLGFRHTIADEMDELVNLSELPDRMVKYHKSGHHVDGYRKIRYDPASPGRHWLLFCEIPESVALGNIFDARNTMLIVGLFVAAISLVVITWVSTRKMVSPILQLSEAVRKLERGDFAARVGDDGLTDEIGELAASVNRMAGTIETNVYELNVLNRITVAASSSLSVDEIARKALDAILQLRLLKFEKKAAIFVADKASRTLRLAASHGFTEEQEALDAVVPFGDCLCGRAAATGGSIVSETCCDDPNHTRKYAGMTPHGHLVVPLKSGDAVLGILVFYLAAGTSITPGDSRLYHSIADVLAISFQNALNFEGIDRMKHRLGLILNSLGEGVYGLDKAGVCTFMNPTAERMLGYGTGELDGTLLHPITHHTRPDGSAYPREECKIYASARDNAAHRVDDEVFWRKDGSRFPVEYTSTPIQDESGAAVGTVVVFTDITERKWAERAIRRSNLLLSAISRAQSGFISAVDPHDLFDELLGNLLSTTDSEYGFIGEIFRDADGTPYLKTHAITNIAWSEETRKFYEEHGRTGFEFRNLTSLYGTVIVTGRALISNSPSTDPRRGGVPQGHPPINAFLGLPFYSGEEMVGMAGLANRPGGYDEHLVEYLQPLIATCGSLVEAHRNSRLRKAAEDKIVEYAETLEARVEQRTAELESARHTAESATRAKSDFLANMSHELRTPLNAILGFSEILREGLAGEVSAQQREYLNDVWESGSHLLKLINDILDISKIEAGRMELERGTIDFSALLGETLVLFREKAARHRISLHAEVADGVPAVNADERKVKQVLINLLSNALKFTPEGGEVGVCAAREGGEVQVSVWDTGIGIAPEDQGRLFQPFHQLEAAMTKRYEGTGLGLHLCRKLVELHGGRILVESTPGQGSRFTFTIPIVPAGKASQEGVM